MPGLIAIANNTNAGYTVISGCNFYSDSGSTSTNSVSRIYKSSITNTINTVNTTNIINNYISLDGTYSLDGGNWSDTTFTVSTGSTIVINNATNFTNCTFVWPDPTANLTPTQKIQMELSQQRAKRELALYTKERAVRRIRARGPLKRGLKLMESLGMDKDIRVFMSGNEIEVSHPDSLLKFVLRKRYRTDLIGLTANPGHGTPYNLELWSKHSEVKIASLCVFMANTPILDQILAVSMFVRTGNEEEILSKANWYGSCKDNELCDIMALEYPLLAPKFRSSKSRVSSNTFSLAS